MKLENWSLGVAVNNPYLAPELMGCHLHGNVYGKPGFDDGDPVTTSRIVGKRGVDTVVTASGSAYELGLIDLNYGRLFPQARSRLFASLPEMGDETEMKEGA